jgi:hypothetical protein
LIETGPGACEDASGIPGKPSSDSDLIFVPECPASLNLGLVITGIALLICCTKDIVLSLRGVSNQKLQIFSQHIELLLQISRLGITGCASGDYRTPKAYPVLSGSKSLSWNVTGFRIPP